MSFICVCPFIFSLSASATSEPPQHSLSLIVFFFSVILADEGERGECFQEKSDRQAAKSERSDLYAVNGQTGVRITLCSFLSTSPFHLGRVERSRAHHKCSAALQGGSKHSLSDLGAGTEQSPASHQSWQGWMAVWPLLMGEGGRRWGSGDGEALPKDQKATNCCNTKHQNKTKLGGFVCQRAKRKKKF